MISQMRFVLAALAVMTMVAAAAASGGGAASQAAEKTIQGVWQTAVTPRNCQTGDALATAFPGLFTFHNGGTMAEYGVSPGLTPALRSPGHGVWQRSHGWQEYSFAFTFARYDASGAFIGSQKIVANAQLGAGGDELATSSVVEVYNASGNVVGTFCATAAATRFTQ
jgi:hypothetical protein